MLLTSKDRRNNSLLTEFEKLNQVEQTLFIVENLKLLSFSLLKFVNSVCNDLVEQKCANNSLSNKSGINHDSAGLEANQYTIILEEQANDLSYFQVLKDKPIENKLKMLHSYLPLLKAEAKETELKRKLKTFYHDLLVDLFNYCLKSNSYASDCLSLSLLAYFHPLFDSSQKQVFKKWSEIFELCLLSDKTPLVQMNSIQNYSFEENGENDLTSSMENKESIRRNDQNNINDELIVDEDEKFQSLYHEQYDPKAGEYLPTMLGKNPIPIGQEKKDSKSNNTDGCSDGSNDTVIFQAQQQRNQMDAKWRKERFRLQISNSLPSAVTYSSLPQNDYALGNEACEPFMSLNENKNYLNPVYQSKIKLSNQSFNSINDLNNSMSANTLKDNGMKNVPQWLKHLRLHKYTSLFNQLTYEQMMNLTDEKLIDLKITLGARKKILQSIEKLKSRNDRIKQCIKNLDDDEANPNQPDIQKILDELIEISMTPLKLQNKQPTSLASLNNLSIEKLNEHENNTDKDHDPENLTTLIVELLEKIQKYLLREKTVVAGNDEKLNELVSNFLKIIDKLFLTKAFSDIQQTQMAKIRGSLHEKTQQPVKIAHSFPFQKTRKLQLQNGNNRQDTSLNNFTQYQPTNMYFPVVNQHHQFDTENVQFQNNFVNARQRLQFKSSKRSSLEKTVSMPFYPQQF